MFESQGIKVSVSGGGDGRCCQQYGCRESSRHIYIGDNRYTQVAAREYILCMRAVCVSIRSADSLMAIKDDPLGEIEDIVWSFE